FGGLENTKRARETSGSPPTEVVGHLRPLGPKCSEQPTGPVGGSVPSGFPFVGLWGLPNLPTHPPRWPPLAAEQVRPVGLTAFPGVPFGTFPSEPFGSS